MIWFQPSVGPLVETPLWDVTDELSSVGRLYRMANFEGIS
jgi:hypothetical protein